MFYFLKIYMASEFIGVMYNGGDPVSGAEVTRKVNDVTNDKDKVQTTITDKNGNFKFDAITAYSPSKFLPFEMRFHQRITVNYSGESVYVFSTTKNNTVNGGEFSNMDEKYNVIPVMLNFTCDLMNQDEIMKHANGEYSGLCRLAK